MSSLRLPACHRSKRAFAPKNCKRTVARYREDTRPELIKAPLIADSTLCDLEFKLQEEGDAMAALERFNLALRQLQPDDWRRRLRPVLNEFCFNLESFNPAFTGVLFQVQTAIGNSDYVRRDNALKHLIVPLAGEYGMHNNEPQTKTHRQLYDDWVQSLIGESASDLIETSPEPTNARALMYDMMRDIMTNGQVEACPLTHACYALGYNLAIEYLADYEKRWMLQSFQYMDKKFLAEQGVKMDWTFLEVHALDEKEHAALGHKAVTSFVPVAYARVLERAMMDHDRDFAVFYSAMTAMLTRPASSMQGAGLR